MTDPGVPPAVERFLERAARLSPSAWEEIEAHARQPLGATLARLWAGVTFQRRLRMPGSRLAQVYSSAVEQRVKQFVEAGRLPRTSGWRAVMELGTAVQALNARAAWTEKEFTDLYAPFEPYIPVDSLEMEQEH